MRDHWPTGKVDSKFICCIENHIWYIRSGSGAIKHRHSDLVNVPAFDSKVLRHACLVSYVGHYTGTHLLNILQRSSCAVCICEGSNSGDGGDMQSHMCMRWNSVCEGNEGEIKIHFQSCSFTKPIYSNDLKCTVDFTFPPFITRLCMHIRTNIDVLRPTV